jgi:hypothetical protein
MNTPHLDAILSHPHSFDCGFAALDRTNCMCRRDDARAELAALKRELVLLHDEKWMRLRPGYTYLPSAMHDELLADLHNQRIRLEEREVKIKRQQGELCRLSRSRASLRAELLRVKLERGDYLPKEPR